MTAICKETLAEGVELYLGDCLDVLATLPADSIEACVTDPPYHLVQNSRNGSPQPGDLGTPFGRSGPSNARGFMGQKWDGGDIAMRPETWAAVLRVLRPGAHLLAFGGTRTFHRMACAIEDAGFELRDTIAWVYGSGFPKSHDVSKGIDKAAGAEREVTGVAGRSGGGRLCMDAGTRSGDLAGEYMETAPATAAAREWSGWGSALKPAMELICVARKPLSEKTIAGNVLAHRTGALNIDACRVATDDETGRTANVSFGLMHEGREKQGGVAGSYGGSQLGRWPANLCHDGSDEVTELFPDSNGAVSNGRSGDSSGYGGGFGSQPQKPGRADSGSAARFFYTAKADADNRLGSKHPTVKPLDLMQWLVRLVTPKGGTVIDPFAGSGTTGEAAIREGMRAVLIEREPEYQADIRRRIKLAMAGPGERARESVKASGKTADAGPLFAPAFGS